MLAVKCIYACYQMYLCLLSKMFLIPVKDVFLLSKTQYPLLTLLHKPLGGTCSSTNANGMHVVRKPRLVYLLRTFYLITVRIDRMTLLEKHLAIARLTSDRKSVV